MVVSKLPDGSDRQWSRNWRDWRRISAHNRDDLIAVHLQSRVETNDDVVGEDALRVLLGSASLQGQLDFVAQLAFADDLAGTVTIKVRVGDSVKLFVEFHIHLCEKKKRFSDIFAQKTASNPLSCCSTHAGKHTQKCAVCSRNSTSGLI